MSGKDDADESRRRYKAPYTPRHTIPTVQKYREERQARQDEANEERDADDADLPESTTVQAKSSGEQYGQRGEDQEQKRQNGGAGRQDGTRGEDKDGDDDSTAGFEDEEPAVDTSEIDPKSTDTKQRRKGMKKKKGKDEKAERQVTDPVTHLPVTIHDYTSKALEDVPENDPPFGSTKRTATGLSNKNKSNKDLQREKFESEKGREATQALFPPPDFDKVRSEMTDINKRGITVGVVGTAVIVTLAFAIERLLRLEKVPNATTKQVSMRWSFGVAVWLCLALVTVGGIWALIVGVREWTTKKLGRYWEDSVWQGNFNSRERHAKAHENESVTWLNMLLSSVWPLVNPDLFTSLADTLEDVMQASLPKLVQMVSVDDIGQGSESLRILGVRWLPTGAAARSVGSKGKLNPAGDSKHQNDRSVPGEGEIDDRAEDKDNKNDDDKRDDPSGDSGDKAEDGSEKQQVAEGMEAEEGDFVNLEVAFAYRARSGKVTMKDRMRDMHLYLAFYLPGNIKVPVWVDLRGIVGTMRMRLQLAPDPPFFALCTLTFLGQPRIELSCTPLLKQAPNVMDLPLISNFVQASVDAAMAEYVAPKSLTLDLKDMLAGDDFKKDTSARGVIVVHIKRGFDFRVGDPGIPLIRDGSADPYVSVGWAKFGKPLWSTRVLMSEMEPCWNETAYLLVTPEELNVGERLRVQLWDSDRFTADDDLGRIELDMKQLMKGDETNGKMCDRTDGFKALEAGENMPGKLEWSVGYFSKTRIQECQLQQQTHDPDVRSMEELREKVDDVCRKKLREADIKKGRNSRDEDELEQQKAQEMKASEDAMIISAPPPEGYPSGVFSIQIHQITGLELEKLNKNQADKDSEGYDEEESGDGLPSSYCTVIINHAKVFKTRTKPKNSKPFFNAGVERFLPDWRNAEVYLSVRDARIKEDDPLLGIVHLPLSEVFKERSQVSGFYPLMGGVGFGRVRLSMVWRSVQLQAPLQALGWSYGTVEARSSVTVVDLPQELQKMKIRFRTDLGKGKMYPNKEDDGWSTSKRKSLKLPVQKRYGSCLAIQFRHHSLVSDKTAAFAVLWLREIPDDEEEEVTLPVWKGEYKRAIACCLDECGERLGSIKVKLVFWSGLGGAHSKWASRDPNMRDVVQVLEVARDNYESHKTAKQAGVVQEESDSSSEEDEEESSDDENDSQRPDDAASAIDRGGQDKSNGDKDDKKSKQSLLDSAKDYKKHMKSEHRRNRGAMQWRIPRTTQWVYHKAGRTQDKVASLFKHHTRQPGIETEV